MRRMLKYRKRELLPVAAVQLNLDNLADFTFTKWGGIQEAHEGDWLVNNDGDCYTIAADTFEATYECISLGKYHKTAPVWAYRSMVGGHVQTKEGNTLYVIGDYVVANNENGSDAYAMSAEKFESMYEKC